MAAARKVLDFINLGLWTGSAKLSAAVRDCERRPGGKGITLPSNNETPFNRIYLHAWKLWR
jgi:hypothetical protein